ncbi:MAG TPA: ATP-binding protein [Candidatus Polarisedimenticolia bacterium]|nr:ATP-binding protein [Candidatus Polarisedimenticolia bacterium]
MPRKRSPRTRKKPRELTPAELRWVCDPSRDRLKAPESVMPLVGIIGQDRAIRAMKIGIELYAPGYNVFVCGITGTGRTSTVKRILDNIKSSCPLPLDRCYVHNFQKPERPRLIVLPRGRSREFRKDMERFAREISATVPKVLDEGDHDAHRRRIVRHYEQAGDRLIGRFERQAEKEGFKLKRVGEGSLAQPGLFPLVDGQPVPIAEIEALAEAKKIPAARARALTRRYVTLGAGLEAVARKGRAILRRMQAEIEALNRQQVLKALEDPARAIIEKYGVPGIEVYLHDGINHIAEHIALFRGSAEEGGTAPAGDSPDEGGLAGLLSLFEVNILLDNTGREQCPVVIETLPTYRRLFGYYEKVMGPSGNWATDFRKIRGGSLLLADGGYLVLNVEEVLHQPGLWQHLKRTLVTRLLEISEEGTPQQVPVMALTPEPIALNVKVIMIGDTGTYNLLYNRDPDFRKIFKVLADFDYEMDRSARNIRLCAAFVARMCQEEGLGPFDLAAVARVTEYGARVAGHKGKLTARFGEISDLLREADYWRRKEGAHSVGARHVTTALRESERRNGMWEEKLRDMIDEGLLLVEVKGRRIGQINGLTIHDTGAYRFGLPARITASAAPGDAGIINIEREARLSGRTHDKGVLIIGGWFREHFGHDKPVTFAASLAFEQSYGEVDGDSASSTEIYALLSALSGVPLDQAIAVTGSVDQRGQVQPVGGIIHKIEGFFRVCRQSGLTGRQGVIIPRTNVGDLMLDDEVVEAVRRGRFHIFPVRTIEEGIEILTGLPAGARRRDGSYPAGSLYARVDLRLTRMARLVRRFAGLRRIG